MTAYSATAGGFLPPVPNPRRAACENGPIAGLLDKRLAFVTGKGGVGKTTVAYALGLAAAAAGKKTIVCEIAAQERGSELFGRPPIGFNETLLADDLWGISIDPDRMVREYLEVLLPVRAMASLLYRSNLFTYLAAATPGLQEVVSIGKAYELTLDVRRAPGDGRVYDLVIVDAPEEMAVNESADLAAGLEAAGVALDELFVNGLFPERFSASELDEIRTAREQLPSAALDAAVAEAERAGAQRIELERLRTVLPGVPVHELPFLFTGEIGETELRELAELVTS